MNEAVPEDKSQALTTPAAGSSPTRDVATTPASAAGEPSASGGISASALRYNLLLIVCMSRRIFIKHPQLFIT